MSLSKYSRFNMELHILDEQGNFMTAVQEKIHSYKELIVTSFYCNILTCREFKVSLR
jgi:hypothetical protein